MRNDTIYEKRFHFVDGVIDGALVSREVEEMLSQMRDRGINEFVLRCSLPVEKELSRLVITPRYEIVLPDFGNKKVDLAPLPKAIYLLYLRHEEGIFFKELVDHREELQSIYIKLTNRVSTWIANSSVERIIDPTSNGIHEKCSIIRAAFLACMDERLVDHYCITGRRGEKKRVTLGREMVEWKIENLEFRI